MFWSMGGRMVYGWKRRKRKGKRRREKTGDWMQKWIMRGKRCKSTMVVVSVMYYNPSEYLTYQLWG